MPKLGMEPIRRRALIGATLEAITARGSLDVTVDQIARRAGVSPALAFHYFGGKEALLLAAMRHLLRDLGRDAAAGLRAASTPRARVSAVLAACFGQGQFAAGAASAWLSFYVLAQSAPQARRLLRVYFRRLDSNLRAALRPLAPPAEAARLAAAVGAMVDGVYLRQALGACAIDGAQAAALIEAQVDAALGPAD